MSHADLIVTVHLIDPRDLSVSAVRRWKVFSGHGRAAGGDFSRRMDGDSCQSPVAHNSPVESLLIGIVIMIGGI
jgi:hypothetical protein